MPPKALGKKKPPPPSTAGDGVVVMLPTTVQGKKKPPPPSRAGEGVATLPPIDKGNKKPPPPKKGGTKGLPKKYLIPLKKRKENNEKLRQWRMRNGNKTKEYNASYYRKTQSKIVGTVYHEIATLKAQLEEARGGAPASSSTNDNVTPMDSEQLLLYFRSQNDLQAAKTAKQAVAAAKYKVQLDEQAQTIKALTEEVNNLTMNINTYKAHAAREMGIINNKNHEIEFLKKFIPGETSIPVVMQAPADVDEVDDPNDTVAGYFRATVAKFKLDLEVYKLYR